MNWLRCKELPLQVLNFVQISLPVNYLLYPISFIRSRTGKCMYVCNAMVERLTLTYLTTDCKHKNLITSHSFFSMSTSSNFKTSSPPQLVLRYPGRCTTFNLLEVRRVKKQQKGHEKDKEEVMSEVWFNDENDKFLTLRLFFTSHPWVLATHGMYEILKGPLVLAIQDMSDTEVTLKMRDHSGRGLDCIRRKFVLRFHSQTEAKAFAFIHDLTLREHLERKLRNHSVIIIKDDEKEATIKKEDTDDTKAPTVGNGCFNLLRIYFF